MYTPVGIYPMEKNISRRYIPHGKNFSSGYIPTGIFFPVGINFLRFKIPVGVNSSGYEKNQKKIIPHGTKFFHGVYTHWKKFFPVGIYPWKFFPGGYIPHGVYSLVLSLPLKYGRHFLPLGLQTFPCCNREQLPSSYVG